MKLAKSTTTSIETTISNLKFLLENLSREEVSLAEVIQADELGLEVLSTDHRINKVFFDTMAHVNPAFEALAATYSSNFDLNAGDIEEIQEKINALKNSLSQA